jgi:hypothetical protein
MGFNVEFFGGLSGLVTSADDKLTMSGRLARPAKREYAEGTANGLADILFADFGRSIAASLNEDLDLNGSGLQDVLGVDLAMLNVKAMWFRASSANGGNITVSPAASNGFQGPFGAVSDSIVLPAGGEWQVADSAGWAVVAGTGDLLNVANSDSGGAGLYDVVILGASA